MYNTFAVMSRISSDNLKALSCKQINHNYDMQSQILIEMVANKFWLTISPASKPNVCMQGEEHNVTCQSQDTCIACMLILRRIAPLEKCNGLQQ